MQTKQYMSAAVLALTFFDSALAQRDGRGGDKGSQNQQPSSKAVSAAAPSISSATGAAQAAATINPDLIAKGSQSDGNPTNGQSPSLTDNTNFVNFCQGQTITDGTQNIAGSCNPIPMGSIPAKANMISTILLSPKNGDNLPANQPFNISLQTNNLQAGSFTNPNATYYAAPQHLLDGKIIGHVHVAVQNMGDNTAPPDPSVFAFFKGIDDAGDGKGKLQASVTNGVPAGNYRICTMVAAANHQPVMMPVAQRGAQDDCIRVTVGGGSAAPNSSVAAASATPGVQKRQPGIRGRPRGRFVERDFIV